MDDSSGAVAGAQSDGLAVQAAASPSAGSLFDGFEALNEEEPAGSIEIEDPETEYDPFSAYAVALEWGLVQAPGNTRNAAMSTAPLPEPPVEVHEPDFVAGENDGLRSVALGMFNDGKADIVALNSVMGSGQSHVDSAYCVSELQGRKRSGTGKPNGERSKGASDDSAQETRSLSHQEFLRVYPQGDLNPLAMVRVGQYQPAPPPAQDAAAGEDAASNSGPTPVDLFGDDSQGSTAAAAADSGGGRRPSRRSAASGPATAPTHLTLPMHVQIMPEAALVMDYHAHMALSEIIGLLGGTVAPSPVPGQPGTLVVHAAFPCQAVPIADDHMTNVEMAPESEVQVRTAIAARGMQCVGWYHSHPTFQATPSVKDCENQLTYQGYMADSKPVLPAQQGSNEQGATAQLPCCAVAAPGTAHSAVKGPEAPRLPNDTVPFIGVIVSPYNTENPDELSEITVFNCTPLPGMVPMALPTAFPASRPSSAASALLPTHAPSASKLTVQHDALGVPRHSATHGVLTTAWLTEAVTSISASAHKHLMATHCEVPLEDLGRVTPSHPPYLAMAPAAEHVPEELSRASSKHARAAMRGRYKTPKKARPTAKAASSAFRPSPMPSGGVSSHGDAAAAAAAMAAAVAASASGRKRSASSASKQSPPVDAIPLSDLLGDASATLPVLNFGDELPPVPHEISCVCRSHGWDPTDVRALEQEIKLRGVESMRGCMWRVRIFLNSKVVFEGRGEDFIQAARQYDRKCLELRGEDAEVNFPSEAQAQAPRALLARMRAAGKPLQWKLARGRRRRLKDKDGQPLDGRTPNGADTGKVAYAAAASALSAAAQAADAGELGSPRSGLATPPAFHAATAASADTGFSGGGVASSSLAAADVHEFRGPSAAEAPLRNVTVGDALWSAQHTQSVLQPPYPHAQHANPFRHALNVDLERFAAGVSKSLPGDDATAVAVVRDMMVRHKYAQLVAALGVAAAAGTAAAAQLTVSPAHTQAAAAQSASTLGDGADAGVPPKTPEAVKAKLASASAVATARLAEAGALDRQRYVIVHYTQQAMAVARHAAEAAVLVLAHPAAESILLEAVAPLRTAWQQGVALGSVRGAETPHAAATLWCPEAEAALSHGVAIMRQLRGARLAQWQTLLTASGRDAEAEVAQLAGMPPAKGGRPHALGGRKRARSAELMDAVLDGRHAEAAAGESSLAHPALSLKVPLLGPLLALWTGGSTCCGLLPETSLQMPAIANAALRLRMAFALHHAYPVSVHSALVQLVDVTEHYRTHPARVLLTRPWRRGLMNYTKLAAVVLAWAQLLPLPPALRSPFAWDVAALLWFAWLPVWSPTPRPQPVPPLPSQRILGVLRGSRNKRPGGSYVARLGKQAAQEEAAAAAAARQCSVDLLSLAAVGIGPGADADLEEGVPPPTPNADTPPPGSFSGVPPQRPLLRDTAAEPTQPLHRHVSAQQRLLASAVSSAHAEAMAAAKPNAEAPSATLPGSLPALDGGSAGSGAASTQRVQLLSAGSVQSISLHQAQAAVASSKGQYVIVPDPRSKTLTLLPSSGAQAFLQHANTQLLA